MVLHYVNEEHEDNVYWSTKEGDFSQWTDKKFTLGLPFPNLPYYIDGDLKLTQSEAILRHLGRKYKLYGANDQDYSVVDMLIDTSHDLKIALAMIAYNPDFDKLKANHIKDVEPKFKQVSEFLGSKKFLVGDNLTIADFTMRDAIQWHLALDKNLISSNLQAYVSRLESEPKLKSFLNSSKAYKTFFNPIAIWMG